MFVSKNRQKMAPLPLRLDIINHSPTGYAWGYSGSGTAQLAVAILADWTACDHAARALHQWFKAAAIAGLPEKHWSLTDDDLVNSFETMSKERPWLDRLAVLEDGPTVQIVDPYAVHPGEFVTIVAIVPHDTSEANDEVVVSLRDGSQLSLFRDQLVLPCCTSERGVRSGARVRQLQTSPVVHNGLTLPIKGISHGRSSNVVVHTRTQAQANAARVGP